MRHRSTITIEKDKDQVIRESLCREESVRLHRINEAHILEYYDEPETPLPTWRPQVERVSVWGIALKELNNLIKI